MGGIIPTGIWTMDEARSRKLVPASLTLWVLRDDGEQLIWVSAETNREGAVSINAFDGRYGGSPVTVQGNGFVVSLTATGPRTLAVTGEVPGLGPFTERSEVSADGRQMIVHGEVQGDSGITWYEEFNWRGPSPHAA